MNSSTQITATLNSISVTDFQAQSLTQLKTWLTEIQHWFERNFNSTDANHMSDCGRLSAKCISIHRAIISKGKHHPANLKTTEEINRWYIKWLKVD